MTATGILTRLKAAMGPDRDLDAMIASVLQIMPSNAFLPSASLDPGTFGTGAYTTWRAPDWTSSIDASLALVKQMLPGWSWRIAQCCVSDDAWVIPDFNHPIHGRRLLAEWPLECQRDPLDYLETDIDRRPAGNPALALLEALFTALAVKESESS